MCVNDVMPLISVNIFICSNFFLIFHNNQLSIISTYSIIDYNTELWFFDP